MITDESQVTIYALCDPLTDEVRYVGKTVNDPYKRARAHYGSCRYQADAKEKWVWSLREHGMLPAVRVLEVSDRSHWKEAERRWIKHFRDAGALLTNKQTGGQRGHLPGVFDEVSITGPTLVISRPSTRDTAILHRDGGRVALTFARAQCKDKVWYVPLTALLTFLSEQAHDDNEERTHPRDSR